MNKLQYLALATALLTLNAPQAFSQSTGNSVTVVCNTESTHATGDKAKPPEISRQGRPDKYRTHLASRHKLPMPSTQTVLGMHLHVDATAYALYGRTSTGTVTEHGSIAVDPRLIPYGSKIFVPGYGWGMAVDCGGAIQGHIIDLWMPSNRECFQWGRRGVDIVVQLPTRH